MEKVCLCRRELLSVIVGLEKVLWSRRRLLATLDDALLLIYVGKHVQALQLDAVSTNTLVLVDKLVKVNCFPIPFLLGSVPGLLRGCFRRNFRSFRSYTFLLNISGDVNTPTNLVVKTLFICGIQHINC